MSFPVAILEVVIDNNNQNDIILSDDSISFYKKLIQTVGISDEEQEHVVKMCQKQFDNVLKQYFLRNKGEITVAINECFATKQRKYEFLYRFYPTSSQFSSFSTHEQSL
jgi:hypothetical protein